MPEKRRLSSIASRISRSFTGRMLAALLLLDALLLLSAGCAWCVIQETAALGEAWQLHLHRALRIRLNAPWYRCSFAVTYLFSLPAQEHPYVAAGGAFFSLLFRFWLVLLLLEAPLLAGYYRFGRRRARQLLQPLQRLTETAQLLLQNKNETRERDKYRDLEEAIQKLGDLENARIETGDRDLKGIEDAVNDLLRRSREAYRQQARFVSDASHELRTPLSVIRGYADMLDRWGKHDEQVRDEAIAAIRREADGMQRLVEQLLFLARADNGQMPLHREPVDLAALAREVCEESRMLSPRRAFTLDAPASVPALGDAGLLKEAARILVENALRYSPEDSRIALRAYRGRRLEGCLSVQDNGIGIRAEDVPHIFERFYRSDQARGRSGGTGLGLAIAKRIADAHGGYFEVVSREGVGTRIVLHLPAPQ